MYILLTDVYHTRRQRLCHILDDTGTLCWSGKFIHDAFTWLLENEHPEFEVSGPDGLPPFEVLIHQT